MTTLAPESQPRVEERLLQENFRMFEFLNDWRAWSGVEQALVTAFVVGLGLVVVACVGV